MKKIKQRKVSRFDHDSNVDPLTPAVLGLMLRDCFTR